MTTNNKRILVYGATGVQGGAVAQKLLNEGFSVQTISRSQEKADELASIGLQSVIGDLADPQSLITAHQDVNKVFLVLPVIYDLSKIRQYFRNAVDSAKQANVDLLVVNTSVFIPDQQTDTIAIDIKREFVEYVKQSGLPYIILQPTLYMENLYLPGVYNGSLLAYPVPKDEPIAWVSIEDAAKYAVYALQHPELAGQTISVCGPESLTGNQLAELFSQAFSNDVHFHSLSFEDFEGAVRPFLGAEAADRVAGLYRWIGANHHLMPQPKTSVLPLQSVIHGTTLSAWMKQSIESGVFSLEGSS